LPIIDLESAISHILQACNESKENENHSFFLLARGYRTPIFLLLQRLKEIVNV
jgi:hypothetical protein